MSNERSLTATHHGRIVYICFLLTGVLCATTARDPNQIHDNTIDPQYNTKIIIHFLPIFILINVPIIIIIIIYNTATDSFIKIRHTINI